MTKIYHGVTQLVLIRNFTHTVFQTVSDTKKLQVTLLVPSQSKSWFKAVAYPTMARFLKNRLRFQPDEIDFI